jgi:hypothetical protein
MAPYGLGWHKLRVQLGRGPMSSSKKVELKRKTDPQPALKHRACVDLCHPVKLEWLHVMSYRTSEL